MDTNQNSQLPSPTDFLVKVPLYDIFNVDESSWEIIVDIEYFEGTIDTYCVECKKHSTFKENIRKYRYRASNSNFDLDKAKVNRVFSAPFFCTRNTDHEMEFYFRVYDSTIQKIGQYPSIADLNRVEIGKYRKILGESYKEFSKAVGLVSHGIGIGSFVYLRRIFENLIEEAHQEAIKIESWDEENYNRSRMDGKILLLKEYLPDFLIKNRIIYSILSKGIHQLSENECLKYFDAVKLGIELILDDKLEKLNREAKIKEAEKLLSEIHRELK